MNILDDLLKTIDEFENRRAESDRLEKELFGGPMRDRFFIIPGERDYLGRLVPVESFRTIFDELTAAGADVQVSEYCPQTDKDGKKVLFSIANPKTFDFVTGKQKIEKT